MILNLRFFCILLILIPSLLFANDMAGLAFIVMFMLADVPIFFFYIVSLIFTWYFLKNNSNSIIVKIVNLIFFVLGIIGGSLALSFHLLTVFLEGERLREPALVFFMFFIPDIILGYFSLRNNWKLNRTFKNA